MNKKLQFGLLIVAAALLTGCFHVVQQTPRPPQPVQPEPLGGSPTTEGRGTTSLFDSNDNLDPVLTDLEAAEGE